MRVVCPDPEAPWDVSRYARSPPYTIEDWDANMQFHNDRTIPHLTFKHRVYRPQHHDMVYSNTNGFLLVLEMEGVD